MCSGSRLVATTVTPGRSHERSTSTSAAASMTCSQLSSTTIVRRSDATAMSAARAERPGCSRTPSASATADSTFDGSLTARELGEPDTAGGAVDQVSHSLQGEPGLAGPSGTDQRDQSMIAEQIG